MFLLVVGDEGASEDEAFRVESKGLIHGRLRDQMGIVDHEEVNTGLDHVERNLVERAEDHLG